MITFAAMSSTFKPLKSLAGQTAVYGLGTIVPRLLNYLLLTPFYTRVFIKGEYGVVTELYAYVAFLMVLLTYGMETSFFRHAGKEEDADKVYGTSLVSLFTTSLLFMVVMLFFYPTAAGWIQYQSNPEYILYFSIIVGIDAFSAIPLARLRQQQRPGRFTLVRLTTVSVNILMNVFFLVVCRYIYDKHPDGLIRYIYKPELGIAYAFISNLIASAVGLIMLLPDIISVRWAFDKALFRKMIRYALPLLVVGLAGMVNEVADKILLKHLVSDPGTAMEQLGIYGANFRLAVLMTLFIQMFRYAAEPFFFSQSGDANARQVYADVLKFFVLFCLLIFLGVLLYIDLFQHFIGPSYREGLFIVPIILMANLLLGVYYNLSIWYKLQDKTMLGAYIAMAGAGVTLLLNFLLIPVYGYAGAAWAHLFCYLVMVIISYLIGQHHYPIPYQLRTIFAYLFLALIIYGVSVMVRPETLLLRLGWNTLLLIAFVFIVMKRERIPLLGLPAGGRRP